MRPSPWQSILSDPGPRRLLESVAAQLGFGSPATPDSQTHRALGVPEDVSLVLLAAAAGTTRLMLVTLLARPRAQG